MRRIINFIALTVVLFSSYGQNLGEWRGQGRSGVYSEKNLLRHWPEEGPAILWTLEGLPKGYSSATVAGDAIFLTGLIDSMDMLVAVDLNGKLKWQTPYGRSWMASFPDSRCTPTVEGNLVFVTSGKGEVACIDATTGQIVWKVDAFVKYKWRFGTWGCSESPLLVDGKVIFTAGGDQTTLVALNKVTGETVWASSTLNDTAAYASPLLINVKGKSLIFNVLANNLIGVDASNGQILCNYNYGALVNRAALQVWGGAPYTNTNTPVYRDNKIYITSGYNHVGARFNLSDDLKTLSLEWTDSTLDVHHGGVVLIGDYLYGSNWINNANGNWCCIDWQSGKTMYEKKWNSKGSIVANDGLLYCYEERTGWVSLVNPTPDDFRIISSFRVKLGKGPHWAHPTISRGVLYIRHGEALIAYDLMPRELSF